MHAKSRTILHIAVLLALCACTNVFATLYQLTPTPANLNDLEHGHYYTWGIKCPWSFSEEVKSATLTFNNLYNWDNQPNDLYVHLLNTGTLGVREWSDTTSGDQFRKQGVLLEHFKDLSTKPRTYKVNFTPSELQTLNLYDDDGLIAFGFDPDCHFYNSGVTLTVQTQSVPEPATLTLLAVAAIAYARKRRSFLCQSSVGFGVGKSSRQRL